MRTAPCLALAAAACLSACTYLPNFPESEGRIPGVVEGGVRPELVREGYEFTEGPLGTPDGGLYFTELRKAQRIYYLDPAGKITVFREKSNNTNGLAWTYAGELIGAEGLGARVSRVAADKSVELTAGDGRQKLMAPNDLVADAKGGIYFTDPGPRPLVAGRKAYVYYLPAGAKQAVVVDDTIVRPNGLILTLDGGTLIVADSVGDTLFAFPVQAGGRLGEKRPFAKLRDIPGGKESGADGIALDSAGRLYVTAITGVQVFDADGKYLGNIKLPRKPSNVAFSGPGKRMLYVTAQEGLYVVPTITSGPNRPGK